MIKSPAFQFYPKDFVSDLNVIVMNMEERGIYITLLSHCWLEDGLPNDQEELQNICAYPENWEKTWCKVGKCFYEKNGKLYNKRLEKEFKKQKAWKQKSKLGGIKSGESRRKKVEPKLKGGSSKNEPKGNSSSPSSFPSSSSIKKEKTLGQDKLDQAFKEIWELWPRKEHKGKAKEKFIYLIRVKDVDPQRIKNAVTGYLRCEGSKGTEKWYVMYLKTFLYAGNKQKGIPGTWEEYEKYADPEYKYKPCL